MRNQISAHAPYPFTPPGQGRGVDKQRWTRSWNDIRPNQRRVMTIREATRAHGSRNTAEHSQLHLTLLSRSRPRVGKTGAQMHPPYSIHSSKKRVRDAMKAWRKSVMKEDQDAS